jgi:hypothetical protein
MLCIEQRLIRLFLKQRANDDVIDTFSVDPRYRSDGVDSGADDHGKSGDAE